MLLCLPVNERIKFSVALLTCSAFNLLSDLLTSASVAVISLKWAFMPLYKYY
jgi:hypothetical protein